MLWILLEAMIVGVEVVKPRICRNICIELGIWIRDTKILVWLCFELLNLSVLSFELLWWWRCRWVKGLLRGRGH